LREQLFNTMATGDETKLRLTSRDVHAERLAQFRELFPDAFTERKTDLKKLAQLLGDGTTDAPERYGLSWAGKSEAIRAIQITSPGTLRPAREESVQFDTTENLIIEGDNMEVLKLLQGGYHGRVKMIYIDPPYNTGNEFIYPDNYKEGLADYLKFSRQVSGEGIRLTTNAETDGRYHSKWLTMMYPRLFLARNLLREDGVIFVSIDDHEVHNLRAVMNEIFGEENLVAQLVWEKGRKNDAKLVSVGHEYIVIFAKSKTWLSHNEVRWREAKPGAAEIQTEYIRLKEKHGSNPVAIQRELREFYVKLPKTHPAKKHSRYSNVDETGVWRDDNMSWPGGGGPAYDVIHPITKRPCAIPEGGWRYSTPEKMKDMIAKGRVVFRDDHTEPPIRKTYLVRENGETEEGDDADTGIQVAGSYFYRSALQASNLMLNLFGEKVFENPKDHEVLMRFFKYVAGDSKNDIILDFFAGSGTTAQAVLELNAKDGGNRKFILVQLPEPTERKDFPTIADITKERVRRVINKMEENIAAKEHMERKEQEGQLPLGGTMENGAQGTDAPCQREPDLGFKVFKLSSSNFKVWDSASAPKDGAALAEQLKLMANNVEGGRPDEALLYELVLKSNLPLTSKIQSGKIGSQTFYDVAHGTLTICLERNITEETLRGLIARQPKGVICLDVGFAGNDQLKTNIVLEMRSRGIEFHTA
jgi:adenine-specific DNA-methyltransferase